MAGENNIFNSDPKDILFEAIQRAHAITLERQFVELSIVGQTRTHTRVRLDPLVFEGVQRYPDSVELAVRKLNLAGRLPKDMCYSGLFPLTLETLNNFFSNSYGLTIVSEQWRFRHNGTNEIVDDMFYSAEEFASERTFYLSPSDRHPIFEGGSFELPVFFTEPIVTVDTGGPAIEQA